MQVYVVVWQTINQCTWVLVAKKKVTGDRFGGQRRKPIILNYAGQWVFPGGKVEKGETSDQAARREFFEETGHRLWWDVVNSNFKQRQSHGILYVESNIQLMAEQIKQNLVNNSTPDDELQCVDVVPLSYAKTLFGEWLQQSPEVEKTLRSRNKFFSDRSWFTNALSDRSWFTNALR